MKLVKQPFFLIGIGAIFCAIIIAVVGTIVNPSSSLINKYEKAWNEGDEDLFEECFSPDLDSDELELVMGLETMEAFLETLEIDADDVEYQILVGDAVEEELDTEAVDSTEEDDSDIESMKSVPTVVVIREDGEVVYVYSAEQKIVEIDGEEYIYTGLE